MIHFFDQTLFCWKHLSVEALMTLILPKQTGFYCIYPGYRIYIFFFYKPKCASDKGYPNIILKIRLKFHGGKSILKVTAMQCIKSCRH